MASGCKFSLKVDQSILLLNCGQPFVGKERIFFDLYGLPIKNNMDFEVFFQLGALFLILAAGPAVIILLATKSGSSI
jgi:hypothetical protein